jgi:drug/metabolite transporter (DMT)-like permease
MALGALALAGVLWGGTFPLAKHILGQLAVDQMVLGRFAFASLALLLLAPPTNLRAFDRHDWILTLAAAVLGVPVQFLLQFEGLARTSVAHAALMVGAMPVLLAVAAALFERERLRHRTVVALLASCAGAALLTASSGGGVAGPTLEGDLLVLASLVAGVAWMLLSRRVTARHDARTVTTLVTVLGTLLLAVWVVVPNPTLVPRLPATVWGALAILGVLLTALPTFLWNWGLPRVSAARAGVFINLEPLVGCALGVTLLGDRLTAAAVIGGAAIVCGSLTVVRDR